ncbi:MAG: hypothetical protein IT439_01190 [Phycisphaerales bacterium]|nr:hypothetical protein [Phycisphaerales bacterium]
MRALFLASSWTWCIGMFLPVLLLRDFGASSFWVFAIPNVIGAGAMGWVLARPGASEAFTRAHGPACQAFSAVTLAFQVFFVTWFLLTEPDSLVGYTGLGAILAAASLWTVRARARLIGLGGVIWGLSAIAAAVAIFAEQSSDPGLGPPVPLGSQSRLDLWMLAPVCIFGFALCPYLDLTFHRARRGLSASGSRWAFSLGFGIFFVAMIAFTAWYAPYLALGEGRPAIAHLAPAAAIAVTLHITLQALFTARVHDAELREARAQGGRPMLSLAVVAGALLGVFAGVTSTYDPPLWLTGGARTGELVYRLFMSFYGLVFPAYLWIVAIPGRFGGADGHRRRTRLYWAAIAAAAPFYAVGFIGHEEPWLAAGLMLVLGAGWVASRGERPGRSLAA